MILSDPYCYFEQIEEIYKFPCSALEIAAHM